MKIFYLYTKNYKLELEEWLIKQNQNIFIYKNTINNNACFTINYKYFSMKSFSDLLENVILNDNPITKNSSKIREVAKTKVFFDFQKKVGRDIYYHFLDNENLNLDGYIQFYLKGYKDSINNILYDLVKRCLYISEK